ncbi:unnamed protein product [Owenia fusiformis]|uniref:Uncharacterized protein n=1 Tax=Owenia fusiformis TaxID=6347 RepID=A0A8J1TN88_OWEFU|nr:unnamed protein product [Owenia fusiformis]
MVQKMAEAASKENPKTPKTKPAKKRNLDEKKENEAPENEETKKPTKPKSTKTKAKPSKNKPTTKSTKSEKKKNEVNYNNEEAVDEAKQEEKEVVDMEREVGTIESSKATPRQPTESENMQGESNAQEQEPSKEEVVKDEDDAIHKEEKGEEDAKEEKVKMKAAEEAEAKQQKDNDKTGNVDDSVANNEEEDIVYNTEEDDSVKTSMTTWDVGRKLTPQQAQQLIKQAKILVKQINFLQQQTDKYLAKDELIMQIDDTIEQTISRNKTLLVFKISDFAKKFEQAKDDDPEHKGIEFSPVFRTAPHGYRLGMSLVLNGDGPSVKGKFMSIFFCILRGDFDGILPWPFARHLSFSLLDQNADVEQREHHVKTFRPRLIKQNVPFLWRPGKHGRNPSMGIPRFVSHEILKSRDYIKENQIFIRVELSD